MTQKSNNYDTIYIVEIISWIWTKGFIKFLDLRRNFTQPMPRIFKPIA
jgi:hypothetical protein